MVDVDYGVAVLPILKKRKLGLKTSAVVATKVDSTSESNAPATTTTDNANAPTDT